MGPPHSGFRGIGSLLTCVITLNVKSTFLTITFFSTRIYYIPSKVLMNCLGYQPHGRTGRSDAVTEAHLSTRTMSRNSLSMSGF